MSKTSQASLGNASLESPGRVRLGLLQRQTKPSTLSARQSAGSSLLPAARGATARPTRDSRCARRRRAPGSASLRPRRVTTLTFSHRSAHVTRHTVSQKKTRYRLGDIGRVAVASAAGVDYSAERLRTFALRMHIRTQNIFCYTRTTSRDGTHRSRTRLGAPEALRSQSLTASEGRARGRRELHQTHIWQDVRDGTEVAALW